MKHNLRYGIAAMKVEPVRNIPAEYSGMANQLVLGEECRFVFDPVKITSGSVFNTAMVFLDVSYLCGGLNDNGIAISGFDQFSCLFHGIPVLQDSTKQCDPCRKKANGCSTQIHSNIFDNHVT